MKSLLFSAICGVFCIASAASAGISAEPPSADLNFSRPGYGFSTVSSAEFLKNELNISLSDDEEEYLAAFPDFTVKYNDKIAGRYIVASQNGNNLDIAAQNYSYTASNGSKVIWTPYEADGVTSSNGTWSLNLSGLQEDYVTIKYKTSLTIDKSRINALLNQYYFACESSAEKIRSENEKYKSDYTKYESDYIKYDNYLNELDTYEQKLSEYRDYLEKFAEWKRKDDPYQAYLAEYNEYLEELKLYNSYDVQSAEQKYQQDLQKYQEYLTACDDYDRLYKEYLHSIDTPEMAKVKAQIGIIDYIYKAAGSNRTIYGAIMGDTVTQVLSRKEELKLAGADGKAVDRASAATKNLRNLFTNYEKLTDEESKYTFYVTTYKSLCDNFNDLLRVLDYFYRNSTIQIFIKNKGKNDSYCILVSQLYEITDSLNVEPVKNYEATYGWKDPAAASFDSSYKIDGKTPSNILGDSVLGYSDSPEPLADGYPILPPEPTKPEKVEPPVFAERPTKPVPPEQVPSPGPAPQTVPEPERPDEILEPVAPVKYKPTEWESRLAEENGKIDYRQPVTSDYNLQLDIEVKKYFRNYNGVTVYFYPDRDSSEYLYFEESVNGSYIEYPPDAPQPEKIVRGYTCTFSGWEYYDGTPVDFGNLPIGEEAVNVYPSFIRTPNLYEVIWVIEGVEYQQKAAYGSVPEFDGTPLKNAEGARQFRFAGWDREIQPMSDSPVYYYAQFEQSLLVTWKVEGSPDKVVSVWRGETPVYDGTPYRTADRIYAYVFSKWDREPAPAQKDETYTAVFSRRYLVPLDGKGAVITYSDGCYEADCRDAGSSAIKIDLLLDTANMSGAGVQISGINYSLTFSSSEVYDLINAGVVFVRPVIAQISIGGYRCRLGFTGENGEEAEYSGTLTVSFSGNFDSKNSHLYRVDGQEGNVETRFSLNGKYVSFSMRGNGVYEIYPVYSIKIVQSDAVISADSLLARRNQKITLSLGELPQGRCIEKVYVIDSAGNSVDIAEDLTFTMPSSDVTVGIVLGYERYTVIFCSDDKIISRRIYSFGDEVTPPANPIKAPDGYNSYIFIGWEPELSAVTGDITYNAVFEAVPLPAYEGENAGLSPLIITLICVGACVIFAACVIVAVVVLIKRKKKRNKNKN